MRRTRPFQFGLKAIFGLTVLAAVLAWFARGMEPVVAWFVMPYVCLGLIQCVFAYGVWTEMPADQHGTPRRAAFESALFIFLLTMPSWAAAVVYVLLVRIGFDVLEVLFVAAVSVLLIPPTVIVTAFSWMDYAGLRRDWRLNVLRLLNLANSFDMTFAVFSLWVPAVH